MKRVYLLVHTTRDGDELTTAAYAIRETAEKKCRGLRDAGVEAALDAIFFVREMRVIEDEP